MNSKDHVKGEIFELMVWLTLKKEFKLEQGETFNFKIKGTKTYTECIVVHEIICTYKLN